MELGNLMFGNSRGKYKVNRKWQTMFVGHLCKMGFDTYGMIDMAAMDKYLVTIKGNDGEVTWRFENDVFCVMHYYWGEDDYISTLPNFIYKPTNFEMSWYKYPLRDSYMNQNISYDELKQIMKNCGESLKG